MDAVKFIEERNRMCKTHWECQGCPAVRKGGSCLFDATTGAAPAEQIEFLKEWSAAHPRRTRQSVFLEQYPEASISEHGVLLVCPCPISASHRNANGGCATIGRRCDDCRKEYWLQEVE